MAQFSIASDITPMRGNYFSEGLSRSEGAGLDKYYGPAMDQEQDRMIKIMAAMDAKRDRDLAYQNSLFNLQKKKEEYQRERDLESRIPSLMKEISGVMNSDASAEEKQEILANISMNNPYLANTKIGSTVLGAAMSGTQAQYRKGLAAQREEDRATAAAEKEAARLGKFLEYGDYEGMKKYAEKDGVTTEQEQLYIDLGESQRRKIEDERERKRTEGITEDDKRWIQGGFKALEGVKYDKPDDNEMMALIVKAGELRKAGAPAEAIAAVEAQMEGTGQLRPESRRQLEYVLAQVTTGGLKEVRRRQYDDEALQDEVFFELQKREVGRRLPQQPQQQQQQRPRQSTPSFGSQARN